MCLEVIESPINYMGSKYKLLSRLIRLFPKKSLFYDVFAGGGSVYMNVAHLYPKVVANDLITDLIKIHRQLHNREFIRAAAALSVPTKNDQGVYLELRSRYNQEYLPEQLLALIWSCNSNMMRFNQELKFNQTWGQRGYNNNTQKRIESVWGRDYSNVAFESKHFSEYSQITGDDVFVYLDPPYSNTEAGYNVFWSDQDESRLLDMIDAFIANKVVFGLSGVLNEKPNKTYEILKSKPLVIHYFGDLYQKVSKKARANVEYYITNVVDNFLEA